MSWKPLVGIDERYYVSDAGHVKSYANSHGGITKHPTILGTYVTKKGYEQVRLPDGQGGFKAHYVHRLVAKYHIGDYTGQVNHKDGNKLNNCVENLEWCSASHNMRHSYRELGRVHPRPALGKTGAASKLSRRVRQLTLAGEVVKEWESLAEASRHGFSAGNISAVCRGERKSHAGFKWCFIV